VGQSWEIDEPGYVFGDIYDNMLDNTNSVPAGLEADVSFALGWNFTLAAGDLVTINLNLSDVLNTSGFYLQHTDNEVGSNFDLSESVYYWSDLTISPVPVPAAIWLFGSGLVGLIGLGLRKKKA